jgi:hypothetical protein
MRPSNSLATCSRKGKRTEKHETNDKQGEAVRGGDRVEYSYAMCPSRAHLSYFLFGFGGGRCRRAFLQFLETLLLLEIFLMFFVLLILLFQHSAELRRSKKEGETRRCT